MLSLSGIPVVEALSARAHMRRQQLGALRLVVLLVGEHPASKKYVERKKAHCDKFAIICDVHTFESSISQQELLAHIDSFRGNSSVTGILVQLPLPNHIDERVILDAVPAEMDVDALSSAAIGAFSSGANDLLPCTPKAVIAILQHYAIGLSGTNVCVVGFGTAVGKPLALALLHLGATVTVCHDKTVDLPYHTRQADILVSATGVARLITAEHVKEGAVVCDVGMQFVDGKLIGDVDANSVKSRCRALTPVPGGVGPVTVHELVENLLTLAERRERK